MKKIRKYVGSQKKNHKGNITSEEKKIAKALLDKGLRQQDITYLLNIGRETTLNNARIGEARNYTKKATEKELEQFEIKQQSWDFKTQLNPYLNEIHLMVFRSRQTMLSAIQSFNNPLGACNLETFLTLCNMSWLYLLQAFCEKESIDYYKGNNE